MMISVSIVEDNQGVCDGLAQMIANEPDICCASSHASAEEALREIPRFNPDVVLMGINQLESLRQLKRQLPVTKVIMLSEYQNSDHVCNALAAGAAGFLLKQSPPAELSAAIRLVHAGGSPMSSHLARRMVQTFSDSSGLRKLSRRESEVLDLMARGYRYMEIADAMRVAYSTVHTHIKHIYKKLQVNSNTAAIAKHLGQNGSRYEPAATFPGAFELAQAGQ